MCCHTLGEQGRKNCLRRVCRFGLIPSEKDLVLLIFRHEGKVGDSRLRIVCSSAKQGREVAQDPPSCGQVEQICVVIQYRGRHPVIHHDVQREFKLRRCIDHERLCANAGYRNPIHGCVVQIEEHLK